ncbi:anthranilate phosphoribosyltransferase [Microlunatus ginsengisoli]|uniref:Anthranilate phosphoribosyltransferase n=1 Tax=Microlunatus ginsengisoli TaxID=363863 RepID=A0ABP6ZW32_9ACTN
MSWAPVLGRLVAGEDLDRDDAAWAMRQILGGEATPAQLAAFAVALRAKGETIAELSALADTMLEFATPIEISDHAVDVVGSGGDRANTVNISTMAAIVAAAAGARVVKHGNRAASSACGAADVLEALGVVLDLRPEQQVAVVDRVGIGFLFAPLYHPALRHAGPVRGQLGIPTTFNFLGPLANPAQPVAQAVGVADVRMAELMAGVFAARGNQGLVVHGGDGLDELTTTAPSQVWLYRDGAVRTAELEPLELGIARGVRADLVGGTADVNAAVATALLDGRPGPVRDIVLLNAAAALLAYDGFDDRPLNDQLAPQLARAAAAVDDGAAKAKLAHWVEATRSAAG